MYLPSGTELNNRYKILRILGHGGFGITYAAIDNILNVQVAVKEYFPSQFATRAEGQTRVDVLTGERQGYYEHGLKKYLEEAQAIAQFSHHVNIVSARDYFEANHTAYMVMEYIEGVTLKAYLEQRHDRIPFEEAREIMLPVMSALGEVHLAGMLHRDISPDNIYLTTTRQVKVLDFGAARYYAGEHSRSLSVILKPGYAPEEQYRSSGKQGAWTDVYATGATFYRLITGKTPPEALDRKEEDTLEPPSKLGIFIPAKAEEAILKSLAINAGQRFQNIAEFQAALADKTPLPEPLTGTILEPFQAKPAEAPVKVASEAPMAATAAKKGFTSKHLIYLFSGVVGLALVASLMWMIMSGPDKNLTKSADKPAESKPAVQMSAEAQFDKGLRYYEGKEVAQDYALAQSWFDKAAAQGDAKAQYYLGLMYDDGRGVAKDHAQAKTWWEKAAGQGHVLAEARLGDLYYQGKGVAQDYAQAKSWYDKAAAKGDAGAQYHLGLMYFEGQGVAQDYAQAKTWYDKAAAQGHAGAQSQIGEMYFNAKGVTQDSALAKSWWEKAAPQGDAHAQNSLGFIYHHGRGATKNYTLAKSWYEKAAAQGFDKAQNNLGVLYEDGQGVVKSYSMAKSWYEKAAAQGCPMALWNLGRIYEKGIGVAKSSTMANSWYAKAAKETEKAAKNGNVVSQTQMGKMYYQGKGVAKDYAMAIYWYEKAAAHENPDAQFYLGYMYYHGRGIGEDQDMARSWWEKAAAQGDADAKKALQKYF
jgi:TPR repeat protein/serine/threonine protein kinase